MKRRDVLKATALGALWARDLSWAQATAEARSKVPPSDRVRVGMIGVGVFGLGANLPAFLKNPDVEIAAICDTNAQSLDQAVALTGGHPQRFKDYRRLLDDKDIDAVVISTPEWWHSIMCVDACDAAKDVYVEPPLGRFVGEGRRAVEAARRGNRIVQMGAQQRSEAHFQRAVNCVQEGRIGEVYYATCWQHSAPPTSPQTVDSDLWLADIVLWALKVQGPEAVVAAGSRFHRMEEELPATLQVTCTYPRFLLHYSILQHDTYGPNDLGTARFGSYGIEFHGTKGTLYVDHSDVSDTSEAHGLHVRNFLDCVKSRQRPRADVEAGQAANTVSRLGNLAYRLGRRIAWDAAREVVVGDAEAQELLVGMSARPWTSQGL
jgi:predicted dehydrogenase